MQKITPCLWFDNQAKEAAEFYISVFKDGKITNISYYDDASSKESGLPSGTVLVVSFQLNGQDFMALNGGPVFKFSEAISFSVDCKDQEEVDYYWNTLTANGGEESKCGWLKDKYGLSWQIVPEEMSGLLQNPDPAKASRAMAAMMKMKKLDINALKEAAGE